MKGMKMKGKFADVLNTVISSKYFSFGVTVLLFVVLYLIGMSNYRGFTKPQVFLNLFIDNAPLIIATIGITFVLLAGGIDLSIGSVVALVAMIIAQLFAKTSIPMPFVILFVLLIGSLFGLLQGYIITTFNMQPFIVTLAGQFLARGLTAIISTDTIDIVQPSYTAIAHARIYVYGKIFLSFGAVLALVALVIAAYVLKFSKFGRNIYAIGGNEQSAILMGLPTRITKISTYILSGFCSSLAGIVYSLIMLSGYPLHGIGMEMDAIASSVIGGTLLTGGVGFIPGTLFGVLIQGVIQTYINFQGTLSAWWSKILIATLLCIFIVMQTLIEKSKHKLAVRNKI